jgi:uncharacterized protein
MEFATVFSKVERTYTGAELRPHFLLAELGVRGSGLGAFIGPCRVETDRLVDWEDRINGDRIEARWMVHFIGEFFGATLREGVLAQRLLMGIMAETIRSMLSGRESTAGSISRDGDDLFVETTDGVRRKLSVSIVTASPVSQLLHAGINIDPEGAPVPAVGLRELDILPDQFVPEVLERFAAEWRSVEWACVKVRPGV